MQNELIDGIVYETRNGYEYAVASCEEGIENAVISLTLNGLPVIGIEMEAFKDRTSLKTVDFIDYPDIVDAFMNGFYVAGESFSGCTALTEMILPSFCNFIGRSAFRGCTSLVRVEMMEGCYVAPYAFYRCSSLTDVTPLLSVDEGVFSHCSALASFPVSEGAGEICEDAFEHCDALTDIIIPKSVKRIERLAFRGCRGLKSVTFEDTDGWYSHNCYTDGECPIDVTDSHGNAAALSGMDFDDGITAWYKK